MGHGCVVVGDELSELGLKFGHRGEVAAAQALSMDDAEKDLDLIEPRAVFGQVDKTDAVALVREELAPRRHRFENTANVFGS
jgi:ribosomal protein S5